MNSLLQSLSAFFLTVVLCCAGVCLNIAPAQACTTGACVTAGPRIASVDTQKSALLNTLLGSLLGSNTALNVTALDWNAIAQSNINLSAFINALQVQTSTASPTAALNANATAAQIINAAITAATADSNTAAVTALTNLKSAIGALGGSIKVGDLLQVSLPTGALATTRINLLELVTGSVQLMNYRNVATTPSPIGINLSAPGLVTNLTGVNLYAQVVEPPIYRCGSAGTTFYSAAIRVKLDVTLVQLTPDTSLLNAVAGLLGTSLTVGKLQLYVDIARAQGTISTVNSLASAVGITTQPGLANIYLGTISDSFFYNRTRAIQASDLGYTDVANLTVKLPIVGDVVVAVQAKSAALGSAPLASLLTFNGPYPQTQTVGSSTAAIGSLVTTLITNLQLSISPSLGGILDAALLTPLKTVVGGAISPLLSTILTSVADPVLEILGIGIGEMDVTVDGTGLVCSVAGYGYCDANHNATRDDSEVGCGTVLYAKLISPSTPTAAIDAVAVDTSTGAYGFSNVFNGNYTVIIDNNATLSDITPTLPAGWLGTEIPTQIRSIRVVTDLPNQNFGFFNGSRITGSVFKDNGISGGTANNGVQEASEVGLAGFTVKAMNSGNSVLHDSTITTSDGAWTLWLPAAVGSAPVNIIDVRPATMIAVSGNVGTTAGTFTRATDTIAFNNNVGGSYSGAKFGVVPDNSFTNDHQQSILPGATAFYPHVFIAGSAGNLTLASSGAALPVMTWSEVIFRDANCNGGVDTGEAVVSGAIAVTADQQVCIVVKTTAPASAVYNARYTQTISASFTYTTAAFSAQQNRNDITTVGGDNDAGLSLTKSVDRATAKSGDVITYTIRYENKSSDNLQNLKIYDGTPAFTVFTSAVCGGLPTGLTSCTLSKNPGTGNTGAIEWTFGGSLTPGASGNVTLSVTLQ